MRVLPLLLLAACGGSPQAYCRLAMDCTEGSQSDYEHCVEGMQDNYDDAADDRCLGEYDRYISCVTRTGECDGPKIRADDDCDDLKHDYEDCR